MLVKEELFIILMIVVLKCGNISAQQFVKIKFLSDMPRLGLYKVKGRSIGVSSPLFDDESSRTYITTVTHYDLLCISPCEIDLPVGNYELGVGLDPKRVINAGVFTLNSPGTLVAKYKSRRSIRIAGLSLFGGGFALSLALIISAIAIGGEEEKIDSPLVVGLMSAGCGLFLFVVIPGIIMSFIPDTAELEWYPQM